MNGRNRSLQSVSAEIGFLCALQVLERNGGDDGTRTRGLCRDSEKLTSIFNDFESTDGNASHWKYVVSRTNVYHDVYHELIYDRIPWGVSPYLGRVKGNDGKEVRIPEEEWRTLRR
jgi:hypothetical protein